MNFGQSYVQRKHGNFRAKTQSSGYREELRLIQGVVKVLQAY